MLRVLPKVPINFVEKVTNENGVCFKFNLTDGLNKLLRGYTSIGDSTSFKFQIVFELKDANGNILDKRVRKFIPNVGLNFDIFKSSMNLYDKDNYIFYIFKYEDINFSAFDGLDKFYLSLIVYPCSNDAVISSVFGFNENKVTFNLEFDLTNNAKWQTMTMCLAQPKYKK